MQFYYVYVLKSLAKDFIYVGFTHDLRRRLDEHNSGKEYFKTTNGKTTVRTMLKEFFLDKKEGV